MTRDTAEALRDYCRDAIGEELRAVTRYSADEHDPVYTREDVPDQLQVDEETREMFRHPLLRMHKAVWQLSRFHPGLDDPDVARYTYGTISVVQFPITEVEGIIVTLDLDGELPDGVVTRCKSIVSDSD